MTSEPSDRILTAEKDSSNDLIYQRSNLTLHVLPKCTIDYIDIYRTCYLLHSVSQLPRRSHRSRQLQQRKSRDKPDPKSRAMANRDPRRTLSATYPTTLKYPHGLCRRYGIYVRPSLPQQPPRISLQV